eukprot:CAMPEP_0197007198 /NCGR_PEP_ID=MMETSP1380-20130617/39483_1 /TAXON_ID=5936 /ORGANISM="Euplotes crassus, Strain CT5" /LENGTH=73 /DNA_ID=CAMNT_0042427167 /DNA_START=3 /DNA_END=224 /DNA_ORIENTATION=+
MSEEEKGNKKEEITLKMGDETIMLLSNDDRCYYVNRDVASVSQVITARLESDFKEGQSKEIHLEEIDGDTLEK